MSSERAISAEEVSEPPSQDAAPTRRRQPLVVAGAAGLALLVSLVAYLYFGAPALVRAELLKTIEQRYHREARLDRVQFDPLRLRADFLGFSLPDRDGRPMIAFRRLHAGAVLALAADRPDRLRRPEPRRTTGSGCSSRRRQAEPRRPRAAP
jgi:hypothetical protein